MVEISSLDQILGSIVSLVITSPCLRPCSGSGSVCVDSLCNDGGLAEEGIHSGHGQLGVRSVEFLRLL